MRYCFRWVVPISFVCQILQGLPGTRLESSKTLNLKEETSSALSAGTGPAMNGNLVASGLLTVLIFAEQGTVVAYHELRSDEVDFRGTDASIASEAAVFSIGTNSVNSSGVTLTLNN